MDLFYFSSVHIDKKIRLIELFGGIGTQAMALRDIGADFERLPRDGQHLIVPRAVDGRGDVK